MDPHGSGDLPQWPQSEGTKSGAENEFPPVTIPDHQLLRCIGRGSYGLVWLARNMMGTYRAVKIVYRKSFQSDRPFQRELSGIKKFEPISRSHEGFVDVLHVGMNDQEGYFYYVMELGDDELSEQAFDPQLYTPKTLAKEISRQGKLPLKSCLELGIALSQALTELHKKELVHRDVKPSNVIFVNGVAKLADIGLVADFHEAQSYVGTEGFIPPEGPGAPQADIYSLGKVLYEASTGKDRQEFPELPTEIEALPERELFLELNEIILRACKNKAAERYRTAWEMYTDLLVVANGRSVKRLNLLERRLANLKRVSAFSAVGLFVLAAICYPIVREYRLNEEARQRQAGAIVGSGMQAIEAVDPSLALLNFAQAVDLDQGSERESLHRMRFGLVLQQHPKLTHMWFTLPMVQTAVFSPDGKHVLIALRRERALVLDIASEKTLLELSHPGVLSSAAYSADGSLIATAGENKLACVWRSSDGQLLAKLPHPDEVYSAIFSPDGRRLVTACADKVARIWDWSSQTNVVSLKGHGDVVEFATYSRDGQRVVTTSSDHTARIWDALNGELIGLPMPHPSWVRHAAFSPDGQLLATAVLDSKAYVWDLSGKAPRLIPPALAHGDMVFQVDFSPDNRLLLTAGLDSVARLWLVSNHQPPEPIGVLRHSSRVTSASFDHSGRRVVTSANDGTIRIWDFGGELLPPTVPHHYCEDGSRYLLSTSNGCEVREADNDRAISPLIPIDAAITNRTLNRNGHFVLTTRIVDATSNSAVQLFEVWEVSTARPVGAGLRTTNSPMAVLSDDGRCLVMATGKIAQIYDVPSGRVVGDPVLNRTNVGSACFSLDGTRIAIWDMTGISVLDRNTGKLRYDRLEHGEEIKHVLFSPDGSRLLSCQADGRLTPLDARVWDANTGKLLLTLPHGDGVLHGCFNAAGTHIVTCDEDFKAIVWDAVSGEELARLQHQNQVGGVAFSPDGKWIATASSDRTARVWLTETGEPLTPPLRHLAGVTAANFCANATKLATMDGFNEARVWRLQFDPQRAQDLLHLAQLLSGARVNPAGKPLSVSPERLKQLWDELRGRYPSAFSVTQQQIENWHQFRSGEAIREQNWAVAEFHLQRLLELRPGDASVAERLNGVTEQLNRED